MNTKQLIYLAGLCALLSTLSPQLSTVFAQGSLTPPGPPAPTMKSLDQVEPRTAITNLPVFITQGGSYYLAKPFVQNFTSDAVNIYTNNVTLDLCGFTIQQTGTGVVAAMLINNPAVVPLKNVVVKNGSISGFASSPGITCYGIRNCVFEDLNIWGCSSGISVQALGSVPAVGNVVRHCRTCDNSLSGVLFLSGTGNVRNVIEDCESLNNTTGFSLSASGNLIVRCRASGNVNNYVIAIGNREGTISLSPTNSVAISGSSGGAGSGTTDPFANLSY